MAMWDDAYYYDLATRGFVDDLPYWRGIVKKHQPARILELACGSGRISFPLIDAATRSSGSVDFTGLDASAPLLELARARLGETTLPDGVAMRFIEGDMRAFAFAERFDLIVLGYNSLAYLTAPEDRVACLRTVRQHLAPGGVFAIDMYTPSYPLLAEAGQAYPILRQDMTADNPAPGVRRFVSSYVARYDPIGQTESSTHFWDFYFDDGRKESRIHDLDWHTYFPQELDLLLQACGLRVVDRFGTYEFAPFDAGAYSYLWVMQLDVP